MKGFYVRWAVLASVGLILAFLTFSRYQREVASWSPVEVFRIEPAERVRVYGTVEPGTQVRRETGPDTEEVRFSLSGDGTELLVEYRGPKDDNIRELKTLIALGRWNPAEKRFDADGIGLVPNYGFITAAYLVSLLPLGFFLFGMERRVRFLYHEIKGTTVYEPEKAFDNE